jgi:hypothetical protein
MFVNFYIPNGSTVIKCRADDSNKEYFLDLGAKMSEEAANDYVSFTDGMKAPMPIVRSGDDGSGEYGSNEFHVNKILEMDTKEEVTEYTNNINCPDYDKRGGLDVVKEKAIKALTDD